MKGVRRLCLCALTLLGGCVDFGYDVPRGSLAADAATDQAPDLEDAGASGNDDGGSGPIDAGAADGGGPTCTSGPVPPESTGPQLFYSMTIDKPLLQISVGDVVTWTNIDSMAHTVTAGAPGAELPVAQGGFDSGSIAANGGKWAYRFCTEGTVIYFCTLHPKTQFDYRVIVK